MGPFHSHRMKVLGSPDLRMVEIIVSPSAYPDGETGSRYPTNVYDGNRLLLPILRQKIALSDV